MAGHSKWANIKHKKAANDKKRGAIFTKLAKGITVAAREGGGDIEMNFSLRLAVDKAKAANMPNDNIDRAITSGVGGDKGDQLETIYYEGYGPQGTAVILLATTDNRNRTAGQVRSTFSKYGGNLGESGSVAWQFEQRGTINIPAGDFDEDELALQAIDAGAIDVEPDPEMVTVITEVPDFQKVKVALEALGYDTSESDLAMIPNMTVELADKHALSVLKFIELLEDLDDVDAVWSNLEISDAVAAAFAEE